MKRRELIRHLERFVGIRAADLVEEGRATRVAEVLLHCKLLGRYKVTCQKGKTYAEA